MAPYPPWPLMVSIALVRVLIVLIVIYLVMPAILFGSPKAEGSAGVAGRAILMLYITTAVGHALAFVRLYEGLILLFLLIGALVWRVRFGRTPQEREQLLRKVSLTGLGFVDWLTRHPRARPMPRITANDVKDRIRIPAAWPEMLLFIAVLGVAGWLVFDGAYRHAAPAFSDAPVTLKWMKLFGAGQLYPDGVYPQGMYATLALLRKLSAQNDFLVMSVNGPLVGLLLVVSLGLFLRWTTGSTIAATIAILVYGTLPSLLPYEFARHVGYNSQEFGLLFALPAAWFAARYLQQGDRWHAAMAAAAVGLSIFVHPVSAVVACAFMGASVLVGLARGSHRWRRLFTLSAWCAGAALVAVIPPVVGLTVLRIPWHDTSVSFLSDVQAIYLFHPAWPVLAVGAVGVVTPLILRRFGLPELWLALVVAVTGLVVWLLPNLYPVGPLRTLALRSGEAGSMGLAILAGLAGLLIERAWKRVVRHPAWSATLCGVAAVASWYIVPPRAPTLDRVGTDEAVTQVLRVDRNLVQGDWLLVMDNLGYSLALERGFHRPPDEFLQSARVGANTWCWDENGRRTPGQHNVALFIDERFVASRALEPWVQKHLGSVPLTQIYTSPTLQVWLLTYEADAAEKHARTWGDEALGCRLDSASAQLSGGGR